MIPLIPDKRNNSLFLLPTPSKIDRMRYYSILILSFLFFFVAAQAQQQQQQPSRNDLEKRRQSIVADLKETQAQLDATKKDHKATMSQLQALQAKLNARQKLITNINQEISHLDNDIRTSSNDVITLRNDLAQLQERYAQSVRYAYINRSSYNMLAFLFSASDFNDAVRRLKYMKKYRDFRKGQVQDIKLTQGKIEQKINTLNQVKNQKGELLTTEEQQKQAIQEERNQTNEVVNELKGREKELLADIESKRKVAKRLDNAISEAIRKEIEIARKKAEEEERRKQLEAQKAAAAAAAAAQQQQQQQPNPANVYGSGPNKVILNTGGRYDVPAPPASTGSDKPTASSSTPAKTTTGSGANTRVVSGPATPYNPEAGTIDRSKMGNKTRAAGAAPASSGSDDLAQSRAFEANRGRLSPPVERGMIVDEFGKHRHAVASKVEVENNGIDIQTSAGSKARAVFDGEVTNIMNIAGAGQTVLVKHGNYYSVYSRLSGVNVRVGDKLTARQQIGTVGNNDDGVAILNFQIWKGAGKLNPALWISSF
jgi:septal ring factor EnvC (AmiA/AmiB activator)